MTNWSELEDLGLTEETDEFDPLNPLSGTGSEDAVDSVDESDEDVLLSRRSTLLNEDGEFDVSGGFIDNAGICRLWVDEDGAISRVRVSPNWRDRVSKSAPPGVGLAGAFTIAFASLNGWKALTAQAPEVSFSADERPEATAPMSWEALGEATRAIDSLMERADSLADDEGHGQWQGAPAIGFSQDRRVKVELSERGAYSNIAFDEKWLAESRVTQITAAVVEACRMAKAHYVPAEYVQGERDEIAAAQASVRENLRAMMMRGFK